MSVSAPGARRFTSQHYAAAVRAIMTPTELRDVISDIRGIAKDPKAEDGDRIRAADFLVIHTKGRPGTAAPTVDPLDLPTVRDASSALLAYGEIIAAVSSGRICADSAKLYAGLVGDAAKIALASRAVGLLANGGRPEFAFEADAPLESQVSKLVEFLRAGDLPAAIADADAPALPLAP